MARKLPRSGIDLIFYGENEEYGNPIADIQHLFRDKSFSHCNLEDCTCWSENKELIDIIILICVI